MKFLSDPFEVARVRETIMFKLTESIALGLGEKRNSDEWYYNDEGILFEDLEFEETKEEWRTVHVGMPDTRTQIAPPYNPRRLTPCNTVMLS